MDTLELIGTIFGIISVLFSRANRIYVFPTGIVSTLIYIYICTKAGLYADAGINVYYTLVSIYGWWFWLRGNNNESVEISYATKKEWIISGLMFAISWVLVHQILMHFTDSTVPILDAFTTAGAIVGMWLMARRKVENWLFWILIDVVSIPLYMYKGLQISAIQYVVFTGLAIWGYFSWRKNVRSKG